MLYTYSKKHYLNLVSLLGWEALDKELGLACLVLGSNFEIVKIMFKVTSKHAFNHLSSILIG